MGGRSQRHLREIQGVDSAGETEADYGWTPPTVTAQAEPEKPKKKKKKSKLFGGSDEPKDTPPADE